jgi:CRISPR-associated endonuclease Cas3-HD
MKLPDLIVPTIVIAEVRKVALKKRSPEKSEKVTRAMLSGILVNIDEKIAVSAADLFIKHKLPLADSLIYAVTLAQNATLWTQDDDFQGPPQREILPEEKILTRHAHLHPPPHLRRFRLLHPPRNEGRARLLRCHLSTSGQIQFQHLVMENKLPTRPPIAHFRECDGIIQTVEEHLLETAAYCEIFAAKLGLPLSGRLLGLLHDLGKYSSAFQNYIVAVSGMCGDESKDLADNQPSYERDHATAGAQYLWRDVNSTTKQSVKIHYQALSAALISHHSRSGILDFLNLQGESPFLTRIQKPDPESHLSESLARADCRILEQISQCLGDPALIAEAQLLFKAILRDIGQGDLFQFQLGQYTRFLFSCLLDADRISTIDFEDPSKAAIRRFTASPDWQTLLAKFEDFIAQNFNADSEINKLRSKISEDCRQAATREESIFTLPVPTGGGKTLASLRFALHRAASNKDTSRWIA